MIHDCAGLLMDFNSVNMSWKNAMFLFCNNSTPFKSFHCKTVFSIPSIKFLGNQSDKKATFNLGVIKSYIV